MMRGFYDLTFPAGPSVPGYTILEAARVTGGLAYSFLTPGPFTAANSLSRTWIQRCFIRIDPDIYVFDVGDTSVHSYANTLVGNDYVRPMSPITPPFDYGSNLQATLGFDLIGGFPGATLTGRFCEAFLEQATNLGKLP
jgi:hypothetical protein